MSTYIIYKTICLVNQKIYVGQHNTSADDGYLGSGKLISYAIKKYGKENFIRETIEFCTSANVNEQEIYWVDKLDATNKNIGYNIALGGGGTKGISRFGKDNPMFGVDRSGEKGPMFGKKLSKEACQKISESKKGKKLSKETCQKMSESKKGVKFTDEHKQNLSESLKGRNISKNTRQKMSDSWNYDKHFTLSCREKMSESRKEKKGLYRPGYKNPNNKFKYELSNKKDFWKFFNSKQIKIIFSLFCYHKSNEIFYKGIVIRRFKKCQK